MTTSDSSASATAISRQERLFFAAYAVMAGIIVTFLATTFALWWSGA